MEKSAIFVREVNRGGEALLWVSQDYGDHLQVVESCIRIVRAAHATCSPMSVLGMVELRVREVERT